MSYQPVDLPAFGGGLNLADQPNVIDPSFAIDCLNVVFTERGAVKTRDGFGTFTSSAGTNRYDSMAAFYTTGGTKQLVCGAGNRLEALNTSGGVAASSTAPTANPHYFARFGGPTAEVMFCANGTDQLRQWNGSAFSTPAWTGTAPTGRFVAVTPWDNRLVNARRSGSTAGDNPSTVRFADAGVPTTWGASNYVDLTPGDGEEIMGVVAWGEHVYVFKQSKFFLFYRAAQDASGNPIFNYITIDTGRGLAASGALCAARDGVYFMDRDGLYRTTGQAPEQVSALVDPFWRGGASDFYTGGSLNQSQISKCRLVSHREQLFLACPTGSSSTNDRVMVFDPRFRWWSPFAINAGALASWRVADAPELFFAYSSGTNDVGRHSSSYTTDAGTSISALWKSGWFDLGSPTLKVIREMRLWGKGRVWASLAHDFASSDWAEDINFYSSIDTWGDGTGSDTWGDGTGSDTWAPGRSAMSELVRRATRGRVFSVEFRSVNSTPWTVYRAACHVRGRQGTSATVSEV